MNSSDIAFILSEMYVLYKRAEKDINQSRCL